MSLWDRFGFTLGSIWSHLGIIMGSLWDHFEGVPRPSLLSANAWFYGYCNPFGRLASPTRRMRDPGKKFVNDILIVFVFISRYSTCVPSFVR